MCVISLLDPYIQCSEPSRQGPQEGQLLLSFGKPHNEVVKDTISGWIKKDLKQSGINVEHFKAYSASFASSSTAQMPGPPVEQILKRENWSTKSAWQKLYNKNIEEGKTFE